MQINKRLYGIVGVALILVLFSIIIAEVVTSMSDEKALNSVEVMLMVAVMYASYFDMLISGRVAASSPLRKYVITRFSPYCTGLMLLVFYSVSAIIKVIVCTACNTDLALHLSTTVTSVIAASIILVSLSLTNYHRIFSVLMIAGYAFCMIDMFSGVFSEQIYLTLNSTSIELLFSAAILAAGWGIYYIVRRKKYNTISSTACRTLPVQDNATAELFGMK